MTWRLLVLALACCLVPTSVLGAAQLSVVAYTSDDCSDAGTFVQYVSTGVCEITGSSVSESTYCGDDGNYYTYQYRNTACTPGSELSIIQNPPTCGSTSPRLVLTCVNTTLGPSPPLDFPPAGWATAVIYQSMVTGARTTTCVADSTTVVKNITAQLGVCLGNVAQYCSNDGTQFGVVTFSDSTDYTCDTVESVKLTSTGCQDGQITTCPSEGGVFPLLPTQGYTQYDNANCTLNSLAIEQRYAVGCLQDGPSKFTCSTDGETATLQTFDTSAPGQCSVATDTVEFSVGVCTSQLEFSCSLPQIGVSSDAVAQLTTRQFTSTNCSDIGIITSTAPTGICREASGGRSTATYCALDGSAYYSYQFVGNGCELANILSVQQFTPQCGATHPQVSVTCTNFALGPAPPTVFPPPGWATATIFKSAETGALSSDCASGPDVVENKVAAKLGVCIPATAYSSLAQYCVASGIAYAEVTFSGLTCEADQVERANVKSTGCQAGQLTTCPLGGGPSIPALPSQGYTEYDNTECTLNTKAIEHRYSSTCFGSSTFVCNTNTTTNATSATLTTYLNPTGQGTCDTQQSQQTLPTGVCTTKLEFQCDYEQIGSATTNGASSFAVMIVTLAAWMMARGAF